MIYLIAFFLHAPGLKFFYPKKKIELPVRMNIAALFIMISLLMGMYLNGMGTNTLLVFWAISHVLWGWYLVIYLKNQFKEL